MTTAARSGSGSRASCADAAGIHPAVLDAGRDGAAGPLSCAMSPATSCRATGG